MASLDVCLVVLMTRMELEHVSDTALATNPMHAARSSFLGKSSYTGSNSCTLPTLRNTRLRHQQTPQATTTRTHDRRHKHRCLRGSWAHLKALGQREGTRDAPPCSCESQTKGSGPQKWLKRLRWHHATARKVHRRESCCLERSCRLHPRLAESVSYTHLTLPTKA